MVINPDHRRSVEELITSLTAVGGEDVARNHDPFITDLTALIEAPPGEIVETASYLAALRHGFSYYYWRWDQRAVQLLRPVEDAIERWSAAPDFDLDLLCEIVGFHYFIVWCFTNSSTEQCQLSRRGMRAASAGFQRGRRAAHAERVRSDIIHVVWLAMYAGDHDPMSVSLSHAAPAFLARPDRFRLTVIAWRFSEPGFIENLRRQGATCHVLEHASPSATIAAVEALVDADPADIAISDTNNAIPTALFARRVATAQAFLQAGMPAWSVRPLHGVFSSFGFDAAMADWGTARTCPFAPPWDGARLNPPENSAEMAEQRAALPQGLRLIGNYGRLVKVTEPCLAAVEQILLRCPDVAFVTGGTGDATAIRAFIERSPVGSRMQVIEGFVPGHSWGRLLHLFLDTWPVTGGESCREVIAKGRPVLSLRSDEMPAIHAQRDPPLVAPDWSVFVDMAVHLLQDDAAHTAACERSRALLHRMAEKEPFEDRFRADIVAILEDARSAAI